MTSHVPVEPKVTVGPGGKAEALVERMSELITADRVCNEVVKSEPVNRWKAPVSCCR